MRLFLQKILFLSFLTLTLQGCETLSNFKFTEDKIEYPDWDAKKFHDKAKEAMKAESYKKAIKLYETLETRYPFGDYATQAQLNIAYAYYKNDEPDAALAAADRFIKLHPRNTNVDYAYYLKGLVNFNRSISFIDRFLPTDASQRNPSNIKEAFDNFNQLIRRFPQSKYTPDAKQRILALRNNMAMYEVHVARFYLKRRAYIAAANRGGYVIKEYQHTPAVPYALQVMLEAYTELGLDNLLRDTQKVYALNFPNGPTEEDHKNAPAAQKVWDLIGFDQ